MIKRELYFGTTSFFNSNEKVYVYDNSIKAREYFSYISEMAGGFAFADREGKICIRNIGEDEEEIPLELFKTYKFGEEYKISKVAYENGIESFKFGDDTRNTLWLNQDNLFITSEEQVEGIYNKLKDFTVNSFEGTVIINPALDPGDIIIINGKPVIYQGEMSLNGRFIADIKSKISIKQKQETTVKRESQKLINRRVQSRIDEAEGKITQLAKEQTETTQKLSEHEQTIESIRDEVKNVADYTRDATGTNQIYLEETTKGEGYVVEFKIKGDTEKFIYLPPSDTLVPSNTLVPYGDHFTFVCDKQSRTSMSSEAVQIDVKLAEPLRNLGEVYDELNIIDGKATVTRRIGVNADLSLYILSKEVTETLQDIKLSTFEPNTYIYIKEYQNLEYTAKYIIKNDYSDAFITKLEADSKIEQKADSIELSVNKKLEGYSTTEEMNSAIEMKADSITSTVSQTYETKDNVDSKITDAKTEIKQTTDNITTEVSKKVGNDEIISKINQSAETVGIKANKIELSANDVLNLLSGNSINLSGKNITLSSNTLNIDKDGKIEITDTRTTPGQGVPADFWVIKDRNGNKKVWISSAGFEMLNTYVGDGAIQLGDTGGKFLILEDTYISLGDMSSGYNTFIQPEGIETPKLTQTSLESQKKNFEKLEKGLDIVKATDIYKYNFKSEKDNDKKHIGFVIGKNYKYSKEITSLNKEKEEIGVDLYSMIAVAYKAIQEQQEQIQNLQERIEKLEGGQNEKDNV